MELLEGESLADRVGRGPLPPAEVVTIARQLGEALAAAHDRGVIHADVTPSNALVVTSADDQQIHVKLVDFGLAELAGEGLADDNPEFVLARPHTSRRSSCAVSRRPIDRINTASVRCCSSCSPGIRRSSTTISASCA